jgi:uncharacterized protein YaaN involved in tellurite resistance
VNNAITVNDNLTATTTHVRDSINNLNQKTNAINQQVDLIFDNHGKRMDKLMESDNLLNQKIDNLENTVQTLGTNLVKVSELGNNSVLKLSQQSLSLSHKANEALLDISQATGTVEATTIGLSKVVEIITDYKTRLEIMETRMDSIVGSQTPRTSMSFRTPNIQNIMKKDE